MTDPTERRKRVKTNDLKVGMFVEDVGRNWLKHPWPTKSRLITSEREISQLLEYGITEVTVDLARGVTPKQVHDSLAASQETGLSPDSILALERRKSPRPQKPIDTISLEEELPQARRTYARALDVARQFTLDIRSGKKIDTEAVQENLEDMIDSVFRNRDALLALLKLQTYDDYTFTHSMNVAVLAICFGRHISLSREQLFELGAGCVLHDVGKISIPPRIINKPGRLNVEEFEVIKTHPVIGVRLVEGQRSVPPKALEVVEHHHERMDGSGYPGRFTDTALTPYMIISSMADVYDALSSDRVYHKGMLPHEALKVLFSTRGKHFPPDWVDRFIKCMGIYPPGTGVRLTSGEIGVVFLVNHGSLLRPQVRLAIAPDGQIISSERTIDLNEMRWADIEIVEVVDPKRLGLNPVKCFEI